MVVVVVVVCAVLTAGASVYRGGTYLCLVKGWEGGREGGRAFPGACSLVGSVSSPRHMTAPSPPPPPSGIYLLIAPSPDVYKYVSLLCLLMYTGAIHTLPKAPSNSGRGLRISEGRQDGACTMIDYSCHLCPNLCSFILCGCAKECPSW